MNINELAKILNNENVPKSEYVIPPDTVNFGETATIIQKISESKWKVFVEDRTDIYDVSYHNSEDSACRQFLKSSYPSIYDKLVPVEFRKTA